MSDHIEAILFDMGGTLRYSIPKDDAAKVEAARRIIKLLGGDADPEEFAQLLSMRAKEYSRWVRKTLVELNEREL